jgi:branched-chain amino acid transport system substrate-binding protein
MKRTDRIPCAILLALLAAAPAAGGERKDDPGATNKEIRIGTIAPLTGSWSDYAMVAKSLAAVFEQVNDAGGINGRKVKLVVADGAGDPKKSLEAAKRLVEEEAVLLLAGVWGGGPNRAIRPYLNEKMVPQLFVASSEETFADPAHFPWTMGFSPSRRTEGQGYVRAALKANPKARIAVLVPDDEDGAACLEGIREALGDKAKTALVKEARFRAADEGSVDAAVAALKESGADLFLNMATGKLASRAIRAAYDAGWRPLQFVPGGAMSIGGVLEPAGLDKAKGLVANTPSRKWEQGGWRTDPGLADFVNWMRLYKMDAGYKDGNVVLGYQIGDALVQLLKRCGDDLTRANVLKQATSLDLQLGMLRDGIRVTTSPTDYRPIKELFLVRFDGKSWVPYAP